jgi:hypothetical protein
MTNPIPCPCCVDGKISVGRGPDKSPIEERCDICGGAGVCPCDEHHCAEGASHILIENRREYRLCDEHYEKWMEE